MMRRANVEALRPGETIWDAGRGSVLGFGARRQKGAAISYMLKYTTRDGRQRWHTIGRHGSPWTTEDARAEALRVLAAVKQGDDPAGVENGSEQADVENARRPADDAGGDRH